MTTNRERLSTILHLDLAGYIPYPDHPRCRMGLVKYYCDAMKEALWK